MKTSIPSEIELSVLHGEIHELNAEKQKRFKTYLTTNSMVKRIFDDLGKAPSNDFETIAITGQDDAFILSKENIQRLQALHAELEIEHEHDEKEKETLVNKITILWERLSIDCDARRDFNTNNPGLKVSTMKGFNNEIERLEVIKKENLGLFVDKTRPEIDEWIEKCRLTSEYRENLKSMFEDEEINDELLAQHENELQNLKNMYEERRIIFAKLDEWHKYYDQLIELEQKVCDPNRYNNRGGNLLKEENQRKRITKSLPEIETTLKKLIIDFDQYHQRLNYPYYMVRYTS